MFGAARRSHDALYELYESPQAFPRFCFVSQGTLAHW